MNRVLLILISTALLMAMGSCNKTKRNSNRLMKAGEWEVSSIQIANVAQGDLPSWMIADCDIYDEVCIAQWIAPNGGTSDFAWQFRNKGKDFEISRQEGSTDNSSNSLAAAQQCYDLSGVYYVDEEKKDNMRFSSEETLGYSGQRVVIEIKKK